tara:strand:+ start:575 stop:799 length:225 start_codon:yes stop_codon:yes gene_type:complete
LIEYLIGVCIGIIGILYIKILKFESRIRKLEYSIKNNIHNYDYVTNTQDQIKRDRKFFESEISKIYDKIEKQKG